MDTPTVTLKSIISKDVMEVTVFINSEDIFQEDSFFTKDEIIKCGVDEDNKTIYYPYTKTNAAIKALKDIILEANSHIPAWYLMETKGYHAFQQIEEDFENAKKNSFDFVKNLNHKSIENHFAQQRALVQITEVHWKGKNLVKIKYNNYRLGVEEPDINPMQQSLFDVEGFAKEPSMEDVELHSFRNRSKASEKNEITFTLEDNPFNQKGVFSPFGPQILSCYHDIAEEMIELWKKSVRLKAKVASELGEYNNFYED